MPKLTKGIVDALKSPEKDLVIWDEGLLGFGIRVKPSGVKFYILQYRNKVGCSKRATLGKHGVLTADTARKEAKRLMAVVAQGADPATEKSVARKAPIGNELFDRYLKEHVQVVTTIGRRNTLVFLERWGEPNEVPSPYILHRQTKVRVMRLSAQFCRNRRPIKLFDTNYSNRLFE